MAETLPQIQVSNPQSDSLRPLSASPEGDIDFIDALEYQLPSRQGTNDSRAGSRLQSKSDAENKLPRTRSGEVEQTLLSNGDKERPLSRASVDPVSQEIYERTGNGPVVTTQRGHRQSESLTQTLSNIANDLQDARPSTDTIRADAGRGPQKDRKKGVAFFARRIMGNKRREEQDETILDTSELGEERPEGADVEMFSQSVDNLGYTPKHRPPPPYLKMRSKYKREREFNRLFLAQQLRDFSTTYQADRESIASLASGQQSRKGQIGEPKAIWALEVSKDGKYLASAGQDHMVRIWSIMSSPQDRVQFSKDEEAHMSSGHAHLTAPVFKNQPVRHLTGHTGDILSVSWSKNNFLITSSMDKTVRLWHVSRAECLCVFKHTDFVTSVAFHPKDDRFFLAGSLDSKLRLWSIPDKSVAYWNQVPDMVTSVAFTPDGKQAIAGTLSGFCHFHETEGLRYQTQIHVKSRTGKNAKGSKITGIKAMHVPPAGSNQSTSSLNSLNDVKLLISSNDSRLRLYNLRDKSLEMKFKGHENLSSQIHARFSDDGRYVISGSEDQKVYIWSTTATDPAEASNARKDHWPVEIFEPHSTNTTCTLMLPTRSRQHLSASEDPIYDVCNPLPVTLVSRSEAADVNFTPVRHSIAIDNPTASDSAPSVRPSIDTSRRPSEANSTYLNRTTHSNGNILIAASGDGKISVFRQDCAWRNRARSNAGPSAFTHASDTSSIKRMGTNIVHRSSFSVSRAGRNSPSTLSRQNSTASQRSSIGGGSARLTSYGSIQNPASTPGLGRDRIHNWRQSISGTSVHSIDRDRELAVKASPALSIRSSPASSPALPQMRAGQRSSSPRKSFGFSKRASALVPGSKSSPTRETHLTATASQLDGTSDTASRPSLSSTRQSSDKLGISVMQRGQSYWDQNAWHEEIKDQLRVPPRSMGTSVTSESRSESRSPDRRPRHATGKLTPAISATSSKRSSRLGMDDGMPELGRELTGFSALSDYEEQQSEK